MNELQLKFSYLICITMAINMMLSKSHTPHNKHLQLQRTVLETNHQCVTCETLVHQLCWSNQDAVKYIENQMQAVGTSVRKLYADVMQDSLPLSSCNLDDKVASEMPTDQYTDAGFCKKPNEGFKARPVKADTKKTTKDSRIDHDVDNDTTHPASYYDRTCETDAFISSSGESIIGSNFISCSRQYAGSMDIKSNLGIDENEENKKMASAKIFDEITLAENNRCRISQSCELSNENQIQKQNLEVNVSNPASAEVTRFASAADCCYEIENTSTEEFPHAPVLVKSAEEELINTSSSDVLFQEPDSFSTDRTIHSDDCSYSMVVLSHPDTKSLYVTNIDAVVEQGHKTTQEDQLKLEETCVMVTGDGLQFVPKEAGNVKTNKKKRRQAFSLSKKSARKQEYEELAVWHGNIGKLKGDCVENSDPTLLENQKKLLLPSMSEPEWELL